jgi:RNA polymerase sigma factor (sigma-70 family)
MVRRAHATDDSQAARAAEQLVTRYARPVYRYLLSSLRDPDAADEVFQNFGLRLCSGAFRNASPSAGRFRDYLKTAVIRLVLDYRRKQGTGIREVHVDDADLVHEEDAQAEGDVFDENWRTEVLAKVWRTLEVYEQETGSPYATVLRCRFEQEDASSEDLAALLTKRLSADPPLTAAGVRKTLQRARERFAEILMDEVQASLNVQTTDELEQELAELRLLKYCRSAVDRRRH